MKILEATLAKKGLFSRYAILTYKVRNNPEAIPGQFLMVEAPERFLRRPMAYLSSSEDEITIAVEPVGNGTKGLVDMKIGEKTTILGPLGNGFPTLDKGQKIVLVGGGTGCAPLIAEASYLQQKGYDYTLYLGFNTKTDNAFADYITGLNVAICTMDGTDGFKGNPVEKALLDYGNAPLALTVGPTPMMKTVQENYKQGYLSLDKRMGCGFGICNGCQAKAFDGTLRYVCKDGPVFALSEVIL